MEECFAFDETMHKNGQWVDAGHALQSSKTAKMLRWNDRVLHEARVHVQPAVYG
jgi:hypothetical protein